MHPDLAVLLVTYLAARADVTAITDRIGTRTPETTSEPWVRITLLPEVTHPSSRALHLTHALVQLDCYGGADRDTSEDEASLLARTVRVALHEMPDATHTGAVITAVADLSMHQAADPDLEPARDRFILQATITAHPA